MNIFQLVYTKGPAVLGPLKSDRGDVYYAAFDGAPLLKNSDWGPESSFATEDEAMAWALRYAREVHNWKESA